MLDKQLVFQGLDNALKNNIIPNLTDDFAREQAIAMISVLKNLNLHTAVNESPYINKNRVLIDGLEQLFQEMNENDSLQALAIEDVVSSFEKQVIEQKNNTDLKEQHAKLSEVLSNVIQFLYKEKQLYDLYIDFVREILRKQLNIDLKVTG